MLLSVRRMLIGLWIFAILSVVFWAVKFISTHTSSAQTKYNIYRNKERYFAGGFLPPKPTVTELYSSTKFSPQIHLKLLPPIPILKNQSTEEIEENFYRFLENKDIHCNEDHRLGHQHDGGWNVCFSPPFGLREPCLVYSFGIGWDWQFDDAVSKIYGCRVLSFDPSMKMADHNRSSLIYFRSIGLGWKDGILDSKWPVKTLSSILHENGHSKTFIDYLKFDVEYAEWLILPEILHSNSLRYVKQLGFEIHTRELFQNRNISHSTTRNDLVRMYRLLRRLERLNFRKFNYRLNPSLTGQYVSALTGKSRSCCYELHYVNMNLVPKNYTIIHREDSSLFH